MIEMPRIPQTVPAAVTSSRAPQKLSMRSAAADERI